MLIHLCGSRNDNPKELRQMRCPEEKESAGFGVPAAAGELWILSWGIEAMQGTEISTLISQGQQKGSQGQC